MYNDSFGRGKCRVEIMYLIITMLIASDSPEYSPFQNSTQPFVSMNSIDELGGKAMSQLTETDSSDNEALMALAAAASTMDLSLHNRPATWEDIKAFVEQTHEENIRKAQQ